jgi:riboflavin-specific deaminase-like protein
VRHVWPLGTPGVELDRPALAVAYAYPDGLTRPFVRLNFVASADGALSVDGVSGGLACPGDAEVFGLLRELADVVLAGSGTVLAESYRGVRTSAALRARRRARGQAEVPPVAVVTASCSLAPDARLLTDTSVPPLVLTSAAAPEPARRRLAEAGAEVVVVADAEIGAPAILAALAERGLHRVLCEGGATLAGSLAADDLLDELCLSIAPQLAGAGAGRIVAGPTLPGARPLRLASVLGHDDGLMLRYRTVRGDSISPFE